VGTRWAQGGQDGRTRPYALAPAPPRVQAYAHDVNLSGADLTNGVIDRVDFTGSNMKGVRHKSPYSPNSDQEVLTQHT
jgi:hypothetical protein